MATKNKYVMSYIETISAPDRNRYNPKPKQRVIDYDSSHSGFMLSIFNEEFKKYEISRIVDFSPRMIDYRITLANGNGDKSYPGMLVDNKNPMPFNAMTESVITQHRSFYITKNQYNNVVKHLDKFSKINIDRWKQIKSQRTSRVREAPSYVKLSENEPAQARTDGSEIIYVGGEDFVYNGYNCKAFAKDCILASEANVPIDFLEHRKNKDKSLPQPNILIYIASFIYNVFQDLVSWFNVGHKHCKHSTQVQYMPGTNGVYDRDGKEIQAPCKKLKNHRLVTCTEETFNSGLVAEYYNAHIQCLELLWSKLPETTKKKFDWIKSYNNLQNIRFKGFAYYGVYDDMEEMYLESLKDQNGTDQEEVEETWQQYKIARKKVSEKYAERNLENFFQWKSNPRVKSFIAEIYPKLQKLAKNILSLYPAKKREYQQLRDACNNILKNSLQQEEYGMENLKKDVAIIKNNMQYNKNIKKGIDEINNLIQKEDSNNEQIFLEDNPYKPNAVLQDSQNSMLFSPRNDLDDIYPCKNHDVLETNNPQGSLAYN